MSPTRVIALVRVSTEAQAGPERGGIPGQRRACDRIAHTHGLAIVETVTLDGVSGVEVLRDHRFASLLSRLAEPGIEGVIVADFDRLFRKGRWSDFAILDAFADTGCSIYTAEGKIDPADEGGEMVAGLKTIMSGAERRRLLARTRRGKEEKRRQGRRAEGLVGMPRGVSFDAKTGEWNYVEPEASRVREAYQLLLSGTHNFREIARRIGLAESRADGGLSEAVRTILRQPLYMGVYRVDRRWVKGKAVERAAEERYETVVLDPPLIDPADWQRTQEILARLRSTRPVKRQRGDLGTYHGFVDCGRCGSELWMHAGGGRQGSPPAYLCGGRRAGRCEQGHAAVTLADPVMNTALEWRLGNPETLRRLLGQAAEETARRRSPATDAARRLAELHNRRARVQDGYESGLYTQREASKRLAGIEGDIAAIEALLGREKGRFEVDAAVVAQLAEVFASWADLQRAEKRQLLAAYRIRLMLKTTQRKHPPEVDSITIGLLGESRDDVRLYKKMRRLGIA